MGIDVIEKQFVSLQDTMHEFSQLTPPIQPWVLLRGELGAI